MFEVFSFSSYPNKPLPSGASVESIGFALLDNDGTAFSSDEAARDGIRHRGFRDPGADHHRRSSNHYEVSLDVETVEIVPTAIDVSPASGFLLAQQNFDAAVFLPDDAIPRACRSVAGGTVLPLDLSGTCQVLPPSSEGKRAILCPDAHAALTSFTGNTKVSWRVTLANGDVAVKSVDWDLIP